MSLPLPRGVLAAVPSFFGADESLDLEAFRRHLGLLRDTGVRGVLVCGSTGEFPVLEMAERRALAEAAVQAVGDALSVVVHVGTPSTRQTVELARHAVSLGAHGVAAITPYYLPVDAAALELHLRRVREAVGDTPLLAYSFPARAGTQYPLEVLGGLADEGVLQGVKESGPELRRLLDIRARCGEDFRVYAGAAELLAAATAHGMDGGVLALANAAPRELAEVHALAAAGRVAEAAARFDALQGVREAAAVGLMPAGLKAVLAEQHGLPPWPRAPRRAVEGADLVRLRRLLATGGSARARQSAQA